MEMDEEKMKKVLSGLIQKQAVILGPNVALSRARKTQGLDISDEGVVTSISGDTKDVLQKVVAEYTALSGEITQTILNTLIKDNN